MEQEDRKTEEQLVVKIGGGDAGEAVRKEDVILSVLTQALGAMEIHGTHRNGIN